MGQYMTQPTPITMTEAMQEAYAYADSAVTFFDTLEFWTEDAPSEAVRVVNDSVPLVTPQGTFEACAFDFRLPDTEGEIVGVLEIDVQFIPRSARSYILRTSRAGHKVIVMWRQYLGPNQEPDATYPLPLNVSGATITTTGVTIQATLKDLVNMPFPRRLMLAQDLPGAAS